MSEIEMHCVKTTKNKVTLESALLDEGWDIITFQQGSRYSGLYGSMKRLPLLLSKVREIVGDHPIFGWHLTWAYAGNSQHEGYQDYGRNRLNMYHAIVNTAKRVMKENTQLKILIPSGTAIQDARTALIVGNDFTRDGHHLELRTGRYVASLTWFCAIFRKIISERVYRPKGIQAKQLQVAIDAAHEAVMHPYYITQIRIDN